MRAHSCAPTRCRSRRGAGTGGVSAHSVHATATQLWLCSHGLHASGWPQQRPRRGRRRHGPRRPTVPAPRGQPVTLTKLWRTTRKGGRSEQWSPPVTPPPGRRNVRAEGYSAPEGMDGASGPTPSSVAGQSAVNGPRGKFPVGSGLRSSDGRGIAPRGNGSGYSGHYFWDRV